MTIKTTLVAVTVALGLTSGAAFAAGGLGHIDDVAFAHEGPFGSFDRNQLQRGLQVFTEVCSACHGLQYVPVRTLADQGGPELPEDQVRAYAANLLPVFDPVTGEERPRTENDHFPMSGMENAPDLSLMAKARIGFSGPYGTGISQLMNGMGGPEYIYSLMNGYVDPPACATGDEENYYNRSFTAGAIPDSCKDEHGHSLIEGSWIAMPPPIYDDGVVYADGTTASAAQMSEDVASFLMWTAEPKLDARKETGFVAVFMLLVLAGLLYLTNKRIWAKVKHPQSA
jgi:ubiquinol-cytochrome c reductase cytochrome c1 subunit